METTINKTRKKGSQTRSFGTLSRINHDLEKFYNTKLYKDLNFVKPICDVNKPDNPFPGQLKNKIITANAEKDVCYT